MNLVIEDVLADLLTSDNLPLNSATSLYSYDPHKYDRLVELPDYRVFYAPPTFVERAAETRLASLREEIALFPLVLEPDAPDRRAELAGIAEALDQTQRRIIADI